MALIVAEEAIQFRDLESDHWSGLITDDEHADNLGRYVVKGARTDLESHLAPTGGHLGYATPGF
jgi:hypothetical protein